MLAVHRVRIVLTLGGALLFAPIALLAWDDARVLSLLLVGFFGSAALVALAQLWRPPTLTLDATGMTLRQAPRRMRRYRWDSCGPFTVYAVRRTRMVVFEAAEDRGDLLRPLNRRLGVPSSGLPVGLGGMSAELLADLLNSYRSASAADASRARGAGDPGGQA